MANNYTQFSEALAGLNSDELKWIDELCECLLALAAEDYSTGGHHFDAKGKPKTSMGKTAKSIFEECDGGDIDFHSDKDCAYFRSDESCDPAVVAWVVFRFFQEFGKTDCFFTLQWADFCDKARVGEFGGGAYVVTPKGITCMYTGQWVQGELKRLGLVKEEETG